jgi:hypothetical protein
METGPLQALRTLLTARRVLSLAVVVDGAPVIGLLPFAMAPDRRALVVHASRLARHTRGLTPGASFDALIHEPDTDDVDPMQVKRVTLRGQVRPLAQEEGEYTASRDAYLARFPDAAPITTLGDFAFFRLEITGGRLVTGFGGAVNVTPDALKQLSET